MIGTDLNLQNNYLWRGIVFDEGPVMQTDLWMSVQGVTMVFWGNCDLTDEKGGFQGQYNEWDVFITFPLKSFGPIAAGVELDYLSFPSPSGMEGAVTSEVSVWFTADAVVSPKLQIFRDIWAWHGVYGNLILNHARQIGPGALSLWSAIGYGDERHNRQAGMEDAGGWLDFTAGLKVDFNPHPNLTLTPGLQYVTLLQKDLRNAYDETGIESSRITISFNIGIIF
jgi:hypothetical protein